MRGRRHISRVFPATALALLLVLLSVSSATPTRSAVGSVARVIPVSSVTPTEARVAGAAGSWAGGPTTSSTGETVTVFVSSELPAELGTPQSWADFFAGLVHGPELPSLTAYIAPLSEVQQICGPRTLGCYGGNRMVSMGETAYGITAAEVVRHEYGHHIAASRLNPPWQAVDWGPKYWGTQANVCQRTSQGTAYPGDENDHYELNPGEAWAETYRLMDERAEGATGSGWQIVDSSFYPDEVALDAAEKDVTQPWAQSTEIRVGHRFTATSARTWSIPIGTPLDGDVAITVTLPKGGLQEVTLVDPEVSKPLARALWSGTAVKTIAATVCGERSLALKLTQRGSYGRVTAVVRKP
jgi:hypothetical protein